MIKSAKEIQEMLNERRNQKFRKLTEKQIDGYAKLSHITKQLQTNKEMMEAKKAKIRATKSNGKLVTPFGEYDNVIEYKEKNPQAKGFMDNCRIKPHLYYYDNKGPGKTTYESVIYSPYGYLPKLDPHIGGVKRLMQLAIDAGDKDALHYIGEKYSLANRHLTWWDFVRKNNPKDYYEKKEPKREWLLEK